MDDHVRDRRQAPTAWISRVLDRCHRCGGPRSDARPARRRGRDREDTERELFALRGDELTERRRARPSVAPRPKIVTRRGWGADESLRSGGFVHTKKDKAVFVHHTATGNNYICSQAPRASAVSTATTS
jgi:hypothetical protein